MYIIINLSKSDGNKLIITVDGKEHITLSLDEDITYTIQHEDGHWNTVIIKDGYAEMLGASCPDKLCVNHPAIQYNNESITCLPNKVVIRIASDKESDVDIISR